jgi:hypothetical protein
MVVTETEYATLAAAEAVSRRIHSDSQYQITDADRAARRAAADAYAAALARHDAWDAAWRNAPTDRARNEIAAECEAAERGMRQWPIRL